MIKNMLRLGLGEKLILLFLTRLWLFGKDHGWGGQELKKVSMMIRKNAIVLENFKN